MTPKEKAERLVHHYRMLLMNEDTECGNEVLVTRLSKQCALSAVDEVRSADWYIPTKEHYATWVKYWEEVKQEVVKL